MGDGRECAMRCDVFRWGLLRSGEGGGTQRERRYVGVRERGDGRMGG
jgi:hypothetical protein